MKGSPSRPVSFDAHQLPDVTLDVRLPAAQLDASPRRARRGAVVRLRARGLQPMEEAGPVDLTIYGPARPGVDPGHPLDPDAWTVILEATLDVEDGGRASFDFRSVRDDRPGTHLAVLRRTDRSSRPVARLAFTLT